MKRIVLFAFLVLAAAALSTGCDGLKKAVGFPGARESNSKSRDVPQKIARTDFHGICAYGSKREVAQAIRKGAGVNVLDEDGFSPLFYAVLGNPKQYAESLSNIQKALRQDDDDLLYEELSKVPCIQGNINAVRALLDNGANIHLKDRDQRSVFLYASFFCSNVDILKTFVKAGANTSETISANYSNSILAFASFINTEPKCVRYLADLDGNVNKTNEFGTSPVMWAAMYNSNPKVIDALVDAGANINDPNHKDGYSPLHWAIRCNRNIEISEHLIGLGADVNKVDKYGSSPLLWAVCNTNPKDILEKLENESMEKISADEAQEGKPDLIPLLLKYNPSEKSIIEAYQLAYIFSSAEIANALLERIARMESVSYTETDLFLMCLSKDKEKIEALRNVILDSQQIEYDSGVLLFPLALDNENALDIFINDFGLSADYGIVLEFIENTKRQELLLPVIKSCKNINKQDVAGKTLLWHAVDNDNEVAVKLLCENGIKVDMRYGDNYTCPM